MNDPVGLEGLRRMPPSSAQITDVGFQQRVAGIVRDRRKQREIRSIRQLVDIEDLNAFIPDRGTAPLPIR